MGEGREAGGLALGQFVVGEAVVAAADQVVQQAVVGMVGLPPHLAGALRAAGAAGDLDQQLGQLLAGAEIGGEQAFVHAHHHHPGQPGQVVALGQDLGADQDAGPVTQFGQQFRQAVAAGGGAAVEAQHRPLREAFGQQFLQPFGTHALRLQGQAGAGRAGQRPRLAVAAVVADQAPATGVHGQRRALGRGAAARALRAPAAVVAQQHRGVAAAVLEHQHLATVMQRGLDHVQGFRGQAGLQRALAHVHDPHRRWPRFAGAAAQTQVDVASGPCVVQGFQRGRGAAQQHRHAQCAGAHQGEVAGVVADPVLLLVAGVVFLVDHDQAGVGQRQEHRRAGANHHPCLPAPGRGPDPGTFAVGQARVQRMHRHAQPGAEAGQGLRGQADFRHQHQRLAAARQAIGDGLQVDLGLAAAGDAFEQERGEAGVGRDRIDGGALFVVGQWTRLWCRRQGAGRHRHALGMAASGQGAGGGAPALQFLFQAVLVDRTGGQQLGQAAGSAALAQAGASAGAGFGGLPGPGMGVGQRLAGAQAGRQGGGEHLARGGMGVARQPAQRVEQFAGQQGFGVGQGVGLAQFDARLGRADGGHHPDQFARSERHPHALADQGRRRLHAGRGQVVEQPRQGQGQGDLEAGGGGHGVSLPKPVAAPTGTSSCGPLLPAG